MWHNILLSSPSDRFWLFLHSLSSGHLLLWGSPRLATVALTLSCNRWMIYSAGWPRFLQRPIQPDWRRCIFHSWVEGVWRLRLTHYEYFSLQGDTLPSENQTSDPILLWVNKESCDSSLSSCGNRPLVNQSAVLFLPDILAQQLMLPSVAACISPNLTPS